MSTLNICFHGEIRKIFYGYPLLSGVTPLKFSNSLRPNQAKRDEGVSLKQYS